MRTLIDNYSFNKTTKQVTFSDYSSIDLENVLLITVVSGTNAGTVIYQANHPDKGGTVSGNILTLDYDTNVAGFNNSDKLQVFYEVADPITSSLISTVPAPRSSSALITTPAQQNLFRTSFASAVASGVDTASFTIIQTGTGQAVSQTGGNLVITSGTTANAETIIRSNSTFSGALIARIQTILSQRIANNNFYVELVDVIGDGLSLTVNSATSVTVTIPNNPFTSANVGQSMFIGAVQNVSASAVPGRYAIASVSGSDVTFTVAGWPASGSGTCSLFGHNYYQILYTGTTATSASYDTQRRGYNSGYTAATVATTASPGHMAVLFGSDSNAYFADQLIASAAGTQQTIRASRVVNLPLDDAKLYLQLRPVNGTTNPATTTTWTVGTVSVENYAPTNVVINEVKPQGQGNVLPITGAVTIGSGTVTTVTTVAAVTNGNLGLPLLVADVASAALTTTTTTAAFTPTFGPVFFVNIPVTVVAGTNPTLDVSVEVSDDTGTNWFKVYDFPRITATGSYRSAPIVFNGNRVRYVQTVGGTGGPSFTRAVNRVQASWTGATMLRQSYDRTISLTTLDSTTSSLLIEGCNAAYLEVAIGTATTPPSLRLQGSNDGTNWISLGSADLAAVASSTVAATVEGVTYKFLRARVVVAGDTVVANYVLIKGFVK